jgi:hypothetical protein
MKMFQKIWKKQHVISNLLWIKDIFLVNAMMGFVCVIVSVLSKIWKNQRFSILEKSFHPIVHPMSHTSPQLSNVRSTFDFCSSPKISTCKTSNKLKRYQYLERLRLIDAELCDFPDTNFPQIVENRHRPSQYVSKNAEIYFKDIFEAHRGNVYCR